MTARQITEEQALRIRLSAALRRHEKQMLAALITHEGWHCEDPDDFFAWVHDKESLGEEVPRVWEDDPSCGQCRGTGEGMYGGGCFVCAGRGVIRQYEVEP